MDDKKLMVPSKGLGCSFDTHIPYVGKIDFSNPLEIAIWGGVAGSVLLAPGWWKLGIPAALLVLRYQMSKISA
jgi:hypothetical protein